MARKGNKQLIEHMQFNDYAYAKSIYDNSEAKLGRIKIGLIISAVATLSSALFFGLGPNADPSLDMLILSFLGVSVVGSIVAYIVGGGFGIALRIAKKLAIFGWFILPFPVDIATGICTLFFSIFGFFFIPIVFVVLNYIQTRIDMKEAKEYMSFCTPVNSVENY